MGDTPSWPQRFRSARSQPPTTPPSLQELHVRTDLLRVFPGGNGTVIVVSASAARAFGEALHLGSAWGKAVSLTATGNQVRISPFPGDEAANVPYYGSERAQGSRGTIAINLALWRIERLSKRLLSERSQFDYPWFARWVVQPELR